MSKYIRNSEEEAKEYASRYRLLYLVVALSAVLLFSRLWYLQIIQGQMLKSYSEKNRVKETKIPSPRGFILDRNGKVLVQNLPGFSVTISPQYTLELEKTAEAVSEIINMPAEKIVAIVKNSRMRNGPFRPAIIKENVNLDEVFRLKLIRFNHPGLNINQTIVRHYPLQANGAQLFGFVGEISKNQIKKKNKTQSVHIFEQGDIIGKSGLEETWDSKIRGVPGNSLVEVDARGREATTDTPSFLGAGSAPAKPGYNLVLTIDKEVQEVAFAGMNKEDKYGNLRRGSLVAIKNNGEILAWISSPSYNPNQFSRRISKNIWSELINDPFKPLRNKVIQDHYSPGSTFKPFVALAALQEKVIEPDTLINAPGFIRFGRRPYHDHTRYGYGNITVTKALEVSSNVFFYKMGIALGIDKIYDYSKLFGLGEKTNLNLTNEVPGLIPNSEWKKRNYGEAWQPGENLSNAIGQGYVLATALQMALAYNAIGTKGLLYKPFIVKQLLDSKDKINEEFSPQLARDLSIENPDGTWISNANFEIVKEGLRLVVNGDRGTARGKKIRWVEMAGKTGTTQVRGFSADQIYEKCPERPVEERHHGWFVGYAPAENPEITVAVLSEHSCSGSAGAAPVVRDVIVAYLEKYHPELKEKYLQKRKIKKSQVRNEN